MGKDKKQIEQNIAEYEKYFHEDLEAIEEELRKSKEYSAIIDKEIQALNSTATLGSNRGGQHYLIEHIANAVQLQTQRQGLRKDRVAIKKAILDYSEKFAEDKETATTDIAGALEDFIKRAATDKTTTQQPANLDDEIDAVLNSRGEDE